MHSFTETRDDSFTELDGPIFQETAAKEVKEVKDATDKTKIIVRTIAKLEKAVKRFDYSQLRNIPYETADGGVHFGASKAAIISLYSMFSSSILKDALHNNYSSSPEKDTIQLKLANILLLFRTNIQQSENDYFRDKEHGEHLAQLRNNDTWVIYFHFIIEQYLDKMPDISMRDYGRFVKNLQQLCRETHAWVMQNRKDLSAQFSVFEPINHTQRNALERKRSLTALLAEIKEDEASTKKENSAKEVTISERRTDILQKPTQSYRKRLAFAPDESHTPSPADSDRLPFPAVPATTPLLPSSVNLSNSRFTLFKGDSDEIESSLVTDNKKSLRTFKPRTKKTKATSAQGR